MFPGRHNSYWARRRNEVLAAVIQPRPEQHNLEFRL